MRPCWVPESPASRSAPSSRRSRSEQEVRFQANEAGNVLNLFDAHGDTYALAPIDLQLADTGLTLTAGVAICVQPAGSGAFGPWIGRLRRECDAASGRDSDQQHTYVGAIIYREA